LSIRGEKGKSRLIAETIPPSYIEPDHQLAAPGPAHGPADNEHKTRWILLAGFSVFALALVILFVVLHHQNAEKAAVLAKIFVE